MKPNKWEASEPMAEVLWPEALYGQIVEMELNKRRSLDSFNRDKLNSMCLNTQKNCYE